MQYGYSLNLYENDGETIWIAESSDLKGCVGQGATQAEAIEELEVNESTWLETAKEFDIDIPQNSIKRLESEYSGKLTLRLGKSLHRNTAERAKEEGLSINQYIMVALTEYNATSSLISNASKQIETYAHLCVAPLQKSIYANTQVGSEWISTTRLQWINNRRAGVQAV